MKIVVVGGGAAGMMAAYTASLSGHDVTLIERNNKLGKKLFLTGKGRCNLTNACDMEELFANIVTNEKFMYSALYDFDNAATIKLFNELGLKTKVERGNRVFPESDHSSDVIKTLERALRKTGVSIMLDTEITGLSLKEYQTVESDKSLLTDENAVADDKYSKKKKKVKTGFNGVVDGVYTSEGELITADVVIMATGGKSYPTTGSDGTAAKMLEKIGIEHVEFKPALVPFNTKEKYVAEMSGLSLKNVALRVECEGKPVYSGFGEMLFTHFGVSGPLVLSASSYFNKKFYGKTGSIYIDLKPALDENTLDDRILRDFEGVQNKKLKNVLGALLPSAIISSVIECAGVDGEKPVNLVTKEERHKLCLVIKNYPLTIVSTRGFEEAIITSGGIKTKEINPSTMESKKIKNMYFAGEMVDVDALTGGFNLQLAWSMGHLAGLIGGMK